MRALDHIDVKLLVKLISDALVYGAHARYRIFPSQHASQQPNGFVMSKTAVVQLAMRRN